MWAGSDRRSRLPPDWPKRRMQARKRAGGRCQYVDATGRCPVEGTDCDHIVRGDNHELSNLQWLCREHHKAKTAQEASAARPQRRRPPERHPGLL